MAPVIRALRAFNGSGSLNEIYEEIVELESFSETDFSYELRWSLTYLKSAGFLENPKRAFWKLTKEGKAIDISDEEAFIKRVTRLAKFQKGKTGTRLNTGYTVSSIIEDGCFLPEDRIKRLLERLRTKKNLILQGPPGTGKTWLAKRLAFALMGQRDQRRVRTVQFHPNLSYEDFVKGWRPSGEGRLKLVDGAFMEAVESASKDPESPHVIVIEEINRGNPAQIFGELLTLLEAGKRNPDDALELSYSEAGEERQAVHIPENLHVIGTMNLADRSLAMVDFALRRRFAFVTLEPMLGNVWREWVVNRKAVDRELVADIERRINELNDTITENPSLGTQYCVGHSYVTPAEPLAPGATRDWFVEVVETEIAPLLEEYWFDSPKTAQDAIKALLSRW